MVEANAREDSSICKEIATTLCLELRNEVDLLTTIIPNLDKIIAPNICSEVTSNDNTANSEAKQARIKYAFRIFIRCYRSNEVDENHILSSTQQNLTDMSKSNCGLLNLTHIELGNLGKEEVNRVIMALLSIDDENRTKGLSSICYRRTLGNPFFLLEFIRVLEQE
eukprot:13191366-Ditylum_brightwellii.AAC.1